MSLLSSQLLDAWAGELVRITAGRQRTRLPWRALILRSGPALEVFLRQGKAVRPIGVLAPETSPDEARRIAAELERRNVTSSTLVLRLSPAEVVTARVSLPVGVRDMLAPVLRNQLERLAPWPADQALFAWRETGTAPDGTQIDLELWIAGRAKLQALLDELVAVGLAPGVVDVGPTAEGEAQFNLLAEGEADHIRARGRIRVALMSAAAASSIVVAAALAVSYYLDAQRQAIETRIGRERASLAVAPADDAARRQQELVIRQRRQTPSVAVALEALSRALPDGAYLERMEMSDGLLRLAGKAERVPALIGLIEETGRFGEVAFAAPTTRRQGETLDEFSLSMRPLPGLGLRRGASP
ncbi:MAG: PilN domain-containing protein [Hyphomicrobiaceae bacterium]|nr:PilN domain-containing protein [Hyphomicrobiaceae bacterium]